MSTNEFDGNESVEPRTERALVECMTVLPDGGDVFTVVGENGGTYTVDGREGRCTCPDHQHRSARCKHLRRVDFATGERPVPVEVDGVDEQLAEHTEAVPRVVATDGGSDGGIIVAGDDGEVLEEGDDCDCDELPEGVPCFSCYRDGATFDSRGGDDEEGREEPTRSEPADFGHGESTGVQDL